MIGKISKGSDFGGLTAYLTREGRGQVLEMRGLSSDNPAAAAAEMQLAASTSRRTRQPVLHISVRTAPGDPRLTDDDMRADAGGVLSSLGLEKNQAMIVRHGDNHFHIAVNRVGANGRAVSDSTSYAKVEATLRQIEAERGLTVVPGRHALDADGKRVTGPRTSSDPRQHAAPESVRHTLLTARSRTELDDRLARDGWRMEIVQKPGQRPGAVLIGPDGQRIGAGGIDRGATLSKINSRFGSKPDQMPGAASSPKMRIAGLGGCGTMSGRSAGEMMKLAPGGKKRKLGAGKSMKTAGADSMKLLGSAAEGAALLGAAAGRRRKPGRRHGTGGLSL